MSAVPRAIAALFMLTTGLMPVASAQAQGTATLSVTRLAITTSAAGIEVDANLSITGPIAPAQVRLSVAGAPIATRSGLDTSTAPTGGVVRTFPATSAVAADQTLSIPIRTTLGRLAAGAYPSRWELRSGGTTVASIDLLISVLSSRTTTATPVTWLWPIIDRPHRGIDGVFIDDLLATQIAPEGRLTQLVTLARDQHVVFVIDPGLIAAIEDMSDGYQVIESERQIEREPSIDAQQWLALVQEVTLGRDVLVLPYGDPDLASLARLDGPRSVDARSVGVSLVARVLDRAPATLITDTAWPTGGRLSTALISFLTDAGYASVLTNSRELPAPAGSTFTPSARTSSADALEPLVADAVISTFLAAPDLPTATRVLAEVATIATERPAQPRSQLLLPPRLWNPSPAAVRLLLGQLQSHLQSWSALRATPGQERDAFRFTATPYSSSHLDTAQSAWRDVEATEMVLGLALEEANLLAQGALAGVLREGTPPGLLQQLRTSARGLVNRVRILPGRYTLTAKEQQIPVTVVNDFDHPARVFVLIEPHAPRVLAQQTAAVEVPARGRAQVLVPITSVATGLVAADAHLLTSAGARYGDGQVLTFDVRSIGPVANWVLLGSTGLLALAVALRLTRRIRQVRRERAATMSV